MSAEIAIHFVYVLFDSADQAIYVGTSKNVNRRLREHSTKEWWPLVATVETSRGMNRDEAYAMERAMIHKYSPEFNKQSVDVVEHFFNQLTGPLGRAFIGDFGGTK